MFKALVVGIVALVAFSGFPALAQSRGGWEISSFTADIHVRADGVMEVTETIDGTFFEQRHGIYRFIPERIDEKGFDRFLEITVKGITLNGMPVAYDRSESSGQEVMKIGDPDEEIIGLFSYEITYEVEGAVLTTEDGDLLAWNVTGNGWDVALPSVSASLSIEGVQGEELSLVCYTGPYGSIAQDCTTEIGSRRSAITAQDALTFEARFPTGRVAALSSSELRQQGFFRNLDVLLFIFPILSFFFMFRKWRKDGRDPKAPTAEVVQYDPPDALPPLETMGLMSSTLSANALAAWLIDVAERGYLTIEEGEKGWFKKYPTYTLRRAKASDEMLTLYERTFFDVLFKDGETRVLKSNDIDLRTAWAALQTELHEALIEKGYFPVGNAQASAKYVVVGALLVFVSFWGGGAIENVTGRAVPLAAMFLTALPLVLFGIFMGRRTEKGAEAYAHARGFKTYLKKAEAYRTIWQEQEGVFEKLLPYAIGFGVGKKWASVVAPTLQTPPSWYVASSGAAFIPGDFAGSMTSFANAVTSSATSSSGSGSFSGGGGGGGGGGSW